MDRIVGILEQAALSPPSLAELEAPTGGATSRSLLRLAAASGRVEAVERDRYYARAALDRFVQPRWPSSAGRPHRRRSVVPRPPGDQPQVLIPLLEWADGKGHHGPRR